MSDDDSIGNYLRDSLSRSMRCGIFTNGQGEVMVIHDQIIDPPIQWVEYDARDNQITIILEDGKTQDLGLVIEEGAGKNMQKSREVTFCHIKDQKVRAAQKYILTIRKA